MLEYFFPHKILIRFDAEVCVKIKSLCKKKTFQTFLWWITLIMSYCNCDTIMLFIYVAM